MGTDGSTGVNGSLPSPVAFVLSGGSSLGAVQVGMLRALAEVGVRPELVVGSSVGAVNGAMIACNPENGHEHLADVWRRTRRKDIFPGGPLAQARTLALSRSHLFGDRGLRGLIQRNLPAVRFDDLALPFGIVATNARTGHADVLRDGPILPAILASTAIPGIFPSVEIDGETYMDGGVASNVPIPQALALGAQSLVVVDPGFPCHRTEPPRTLAEQLLFSVAVLLRQHALCSVPGTAQRVPIVYLPAPCPQPTSPFDFSRSSELMDRSYESSRAFLDDLEVDGPGLYGEPHVHEEDAPTFA